MNPWTPLLVATFGWACGVVLSRAILVRGIDAFTLVPIRMLIAMVGLFLISAVTGRFRTTSPAAWKRGAILGVLALAIPNLLMTHGLSYMPVSLGGVLIALIPLSTAIAAHFLVEGERFMARSVPGMLIAFIGCAVLVGFGAESLDGVSNVWHGVAFSLTGVVFAGIGGSLTRRFALDVPSRELVLPQMTVGTLALIGLVPILFDLNLDAVDSTGLTMIVAVGVFGTIVPFTAFVMAAAVNPAWRLGLTGYTVPIVAVALALVFLGETLTPSIMAGAVLVVGGVVTADRASRVRTGTLPPV